MFQTGWPWKVRHEGTQGGGTANPESEVRKGGAGVNRKEHSAASRNPIIQYRGTEGTEFKQEELEKRLLRDLGVSEVET